MFVFELSVFEEEEVVSVLEPVFVLVESGLPEDVVSLWLDEVSEWLLSAGCESVFWVLVFVLVSVLVFVWVLSVEDESVYVLVSEWSVF